MKPSPALSDNWPEQYIGKMYTHCGEFVAEAYRELMDVELPSFVQPSQSIKHAIERIKEGKQEPIWQPIDIPFELCAVGLGKGKYIHHVGIYTDMDGGKVIHADEGRPVLAHTIHQLRKQGFTRIEFYAPPIAG